MIQTGSKVPVITIDGASGTGKGTICLLLANHLGWHVLDSGALYRVLAFAAQKQNVALDDESALEQLAESLPVRFVDREKGLPDIILENKPVTDAIRTEQVGNGASIVAALPAVRSALLNRQRAFRQPPGLVADGRDMGTIVFPDAELKIFLMASPKERALRRYHQLKVKGLNVTLSQLELELQERDKRDQGRAVAPLRPAIDAVCIDTDALTIEQVIERILYEIKKKKAFPAVMCPRNDSIRAMAAEQAY